VYFSANSGLESGYYGSPAISPFLFQGADCSHWPENVDPGTSSARRRLPIRKPTARGACVFKAEMPLKEGSLRSLSIDSGLAHFNALCLAADDEFCRRFVEIRI
jgi:hypothetical protein